MEEFTCVRVIEMDLVEIAFGRCQADIAEASGINQCTVSRVWEHYILMENASRSPLGGRPHITKP